MNVPLVSLPAEHFAVLGVVRPETVRDAGLLNKIKTRKRKSTELPSFCFRTRLRCFAVGIVVVNCGGCVSDVNRIDKKVQLTR
jgi:hypothetical protein